MNVIPLILYVCRLRGVRLALRAASADRRARGDHAPRGGRPRAHLRHRHADDGGRARAVRQRDVGDFDVRLAAGARLPLHRDDDGRARRWARSSCRSLVALQAIPTFSPGVEDRAAVLQGPLFGVHVSSLLVRVRELRAGVRDRHHLRAALQGDQGEAPRAFFYARLPSLQVLDSMNQRAIVVGWIFLTIGLLSSARSGRRRRARLRAGRSARPGDGRCRIRRSSSRWSAGRCTRSRRSRRAASAGSGGGRRYLSAFGFAIVLLNFVPISYFLTKSHNF